MNVDVTLLRPTRRFDRGHLTFSVIAIGACHDGFRRSSAVFKKADTESYGVAKRRPRSALGARAVSCAAATGVAASRDPEMGERAWVN